MAIRVDASWYDPTAENRSMATDGRSLATIHDWIDTAGHAWEVRLEWRRLDTRFEATEVHLKQPAGAASHRPVTREVLKSVPLGEIVKESRAVLTEWLVKLGMAFTDDTLTGATFSDADRFESQRGVRLDSDVLQMVASVYRGAFERGEPVVQAVAEACFISTSAAAKRIRAARDAGLLEEPKGRS